MMNKLLQATQSSYRAQRDFIISELDILLNKSSEVGSTQKVIDLIKELAIINMSINTIDTIVKDNQSNQNLADVETLAQSINKELIKKIKD